MSSTTIVIENGETRIVSDDAIDGARAAAAASATLSQAWAEGTLPGGPGTKSAREWAGDAQGFAEDAAQSAAYAGGFETPEYASQSAGDAATTPGQIFRVPLGTSPQTFNWFRRLSSGSEAVSPLATTAALAAPSGRDLVGERSVAQLLSSTAPARGEGALWNAQGYQYEEAPSAASNQILTTAGGVKLYARAKERRVHIEQAGGAADNATMNAAVANRILNYFGTFGGELVFSGRGTYLLERTRISAAAATGYCIELPTSASGLKITVDECATLQMANDQQTDAVGPVAVIGGEGSLQNITIAGRGRVRGNTAGQTGWTGGRAQVTAGNIIHLRASSISAMRDITVEGLTLEDHFSNPVFIVCANASRGKRMRLKGLTIRNVGEGPWVGYSDGVVFEDIMHVLDGGFTMAGDAFESEVNRHVLFKGLSFVVESGTPAGSAFEFYGSQGVVASGLYVSGGNDICGLGQPADEMCDEVMISDLVARDMLAPAQQQFLNAGKVICKGWRVYGGNTLFGGSYGTVDMPAVELYDFLGDGARFAEWRVPRKLVWHGGGNKNSLDRGFDITTLAAAQTRDVDLHDLDFSGSVTSLGMRLNDQGLGTATLTGNVTRIVTDTASENELAWGSASNVISARVADCAFATGAHSSGSAYNNAAGRERLVMGNLNALTTINHGSRGQVLRLVCNRSDANPTTVEHGTGNIRLDGAANFAMQRGDTLTLEYRTASEAATAGWYEIGRVVIA